jgi:hypothetical protein
MASAFKLGNSAGERLEHVMMCVDEAGQHHMIAEIKHRIGGLLWHIRQCANSFNHIVTDKNGGVLDFAMCIIHRRQCVDIFS